ncbi:hypothetical protein S7711_10042 [Stachybotrys chartarum IBT 7711]|uniref:Uncharacterized protein n=1 Tax=Stachybotrys chartarum (strain CBS 109288 / IBT 7711) TaxID=1280523 RepID=A0A084AZS1_STACB|nr:hypothetical protein S7711_10042 [Stachybotrys chartarum IBT 7711]
MDEKQGRPKGITGSSLKGQRDVFVDTDPTAKKRPSIDLAWKRIEEESARQLSQSSLVSPPTPRRRSYNKILPMGIAPTRNSSISGMEPADLTFSPSSYPTTSSLLPPAPPMDNNGAGWEGHTRVYGGGVCLARVASGTGHGGGFYGATVSPEEMS